MAGEAIFFHGPFEDELQGGGLDGLFEIPEGTEAMHGFEGGFEIPEGGEDNGLGRELEFLQFFEKTFAIEFGHLEVCDDYFGVEIFEAGEGFEAVPGGFDVVAPAADDAGEGGSLIRFVVNYQDPGGGVFHVCAIILRILRVRDMDGTLFRRSLFFR